MSNPPSAWANVEKQISSLGSSKPATRLFPVRFLMESYLCLSGRVAALPKDQLLQILRNTKVTWAVATSLETFGRASVGAPVFGPEAVVLDAGLEFR